MFKIVELLAGRPKRVFTKQQIYEAVWQEDCAVEDKTITVHISNIRAKLRPSGTDGYIQTVWASGSNWLSKTLHFLYLSFAMFGHLSVRLSLQTKKEAFVWQ